MRSSLSITAMFLWAGVLLSPVFSMPTEAISAAATKSGAGHSVAGTEGWLFLQPELTHLSKGPLTATSAAPAIAAITQYHEALKAQNVNLIVLPVPAKAEIYPDKLDASLAPDSCKGRQNEFITTLQKAGVTVIDLAAAYHSQRATDRKSLLYCLRDAHWNPTGIQLAVDLALKEIKDSSWFKPALALKDPAVLEITGDLMKTPETIKLGNEKISLVQTKDILPPSNQSPAVLVGDSHTMVFSTGANEGFHCQGAGLLDLLQAKVGQPFMLVANNGGGAQMARVQLARKAKAEPGFWTKKKVVIWCFSIREVTETQWKPVPIGN
jgi:alginate O-acetyltransferase complex protein AlgJ